MQKRKVIGALVWEHDIVLVLSPIHDGGKQTRRKLPNISKLELRARILEGMPLDLNHISAQQCPFWASDRCVRGQSQSTWSTKDPPRVWFASYSCPGQRSSWIEMVADRVEDQDDASAVTDLPALTATRYLSPEHQTWTRLHSRSK
jgi:hypothetical protein